MADGVCTQTGSRHRERGASYHGTLVVILVVGMILGTFAALGLVSVYRTWRAREQALCLKNLRQIGLAMIQYAGEYDDNYPAALTDEDESAQRCFARLLSLGYLNSPAVFRCRAGSYDARPDPGKLDGRTLSESSPRSIADAYLADGCCSYGLDPRLNHTHSASRAMVADRPPRAYWGTGVSSPPAGQPGSNSDIHRGRGQGVMYNDGHVKWHATCEDDANIDPNIYATNPEIDPANDSNIDFGSPR